MAPAAALTALLAALLLLSGCAGGGGRGLTVWVADGGRPITPDTAPLPENEVYSAARGEARLMGGINDTLAIQVVMRTIAPPAGPYHVRVTDLAGLKGTLPAAEVVSIFRAQYVRVDKFPAWYPDHTGQPTTPINVPDLLVPWNAPRGGGPLRIESTRNEIAWIDLRVPPTAEPGDYEGRIEIGEAGRDGMRGAPLFSCKLALRIVPVAIPSERGLAALARFDPGDLLEQHIGWPRRRAEEMRLLPDAPSHLAAVLLTRAGMQALHEHRLNPVLWAAFPRYTVTGERSVQVDWESYDALVGPFLDGSGYADRVPAAWWPLPASMDYPSAEQNGGFGSALYARLLAAYLRECERHFADRGWGARAFVRMRPPGPLTQASVDAARRTGGILKQNGLKTPALEHLPAESLRPLGWFNSPAVDVSEIGILAPPASWFEPSRMEPLRTLGKRTWVMPDAPPYSASLAVASHGADPVLLPWQAFRYGIDAFWLESPANFGPARRASILGLQLPSEAAPPDALLYPGTPFGVFDRPLPSVRLKRLRRGLLDYELLRLLERSGRRLLAQRTVEQLVPRAFVDVSAENLLSTRPNGWPDDSYTLWLARRVVLQELVNAFDPTPTGQEEQISNLADWERVLARSGSVRVGVRGVRMSLAEGKLFANVIVWVQNDSTQPLQGAWALTSAPPGWTLIGPAMQSIPPRTQQRATLRFEVASVSHDANGQLRLDLSFDTEQAGAFQVRSHLAIAACPFVDTPPRIDGRTGDWQIAPNNIAGNFRLVRGRSRGATGENRPTLPTEAYFCADAHNLYVAVVCRTRGGERPEWKADNEIPIEGATPWGQDVVEVLLNPSNTLEGTSGDLFAIQVKPSGLVVATRGCRTQPPMGPVEEWPAKANVAVDVSGEGWTVELSLPLAALGPAAARNELWGVNVTRLDARRGEYASWADASGMCYSPELTGNLLIVRP